MSTSELEKRRNDLIVTDQNIIRLFKERMQIIADIQQIKSNAGVKSWDPSQEFKKFKNLIGPHNDLVFLAAYSMLLESNIPANLNYPAWSKGEHLAEKTGEIRDFINPILLFVANESEYAKLTLKPYYQQTLNEILK